MLVLSANYSSL